MQTMNWDRVKEVFNEAREVPEPDRNAFLTAACKNDQKLRAEVEELLASDQGAGGFLSSPTMDAGPVAGEGDLLARLQRSLAGRFSLERELGRGGMGVVYLARDVALDRPVAIKLLPPALGAVGEHRARFLREARTAAGLSHPNIVPIHLVEEADDLVYFVMALIDGETLGDRVRRAGPLNAADAARVMQEVAWALGYAHGRGVIHRDVKPDNILLDKGSGRAMVTDFGIARVSAVGTMSAQGEVLGTLRYMSPEQASAESVIDGRSDLYSLGVSAFYALTGRLPFESDNPAAVVAMHIAQPAPPVLSVRGGVPPRLAEAVDRCLAKDPAARFANGEALAEAIADAQLTRREVAPSVRVFLNVTNSAAMYLGGVAAMWWAVSEAIPRVASKMPMLGSPLDPVFGILGGITCLVMVGPVRTARGVLRAGLDERDVAESAVVLANARDANVEYELARLEALRGRLSAWWLRGLFALMGTGIALFVSVNRLLPKLQKGAFAFEVPLLIFGVALVGLLFALAIVPRRVVALSTPGAPEHADFLRKLWTGPVGRLLFKIAGIGLKRRPAPAHSESSPTEVLLGRAANDLFSRLPKDQRARLGDVHEVIRALEGTAATLRARRDALAKALADVGEPTADTRRATVVAELNGAKAAAERRLSTAVAALENLRLDLVRLGAGVGNPDDLTSSIEEARAVGEAVDAEIQGQIEVARSLIAPT